LGVESLRHLCWPTEMWRSILTPLLSTCVVQLFLTFAIVMNSYHWWLILNNLSTNEHMNKGRYIYLRDDLGRFKNAFDVGIVGNVLDFFTRGRKLAVDPYMYSQRYTALNKPRRLSANSEGDLQPDGSCSTRGAVVMVPVEEGDKSLLSQSYNEHV